jgi:HEAT repeat protein
MRFLAAFMGFILLPLPASAGPNRAVEDAIARLKSPDAATRLAAAIRLGRLGPGAAGAVRELGAALSDEDETVAHEAANTLVRIGPKAAVPLGEALRSRGLHARWRALDALLRLGRDGKDAVPALVRTLEKDDRVKLRILAAMALGRLGPDAKAALPALTRAAADRRNLGTSWHAAHPSSVCDAATQAVGLIDPSARKAVAAAALPVLLDMLHGEDHGEKQAAAGALAHLAPHVGPALPDLLEMALPPNSQGPVVTALLRSGAPGLGPLLKVVGDPKGDPEPRRALLRQMAGAPELGPEAIGTLAGLLKDPDPGIRGWAVIALGNQGPAAASAIPALIEALPDPDLIQLRDIVCLTCTYLAADALAHIGPPAIPALKEALTKEAARHQAALALARMGPRARAAAESLRPLLKAKGRIPRAQVAGALLRIGETPEEPLRVLGTLLAGNDASLRDSALDVLSDAAINTRGHAPWSLQREAIDCLIRLLDEENLRGKAATVLGRLGPAVKPVLPELVRRFEKADTQAKNNIRNIFSALGPDAAEAVPALVRAIRPAEAEVWITYRALGEIGPAARPAVPALLKVIRDPEARDRAQAFFALASIRPTDETTIATLCKALTGKQGAGSNGGYDRYLAAYVLGAAGPAAKAAVADLRRALDDKGALARLGAAYALARITGDTDTYLPQLLLAWRDTYDPEEPYPVLPLLLDCLGELGPAAAPAVPQLLALIEAPHYQHRRDDDERVAAVGVLGKIGPAAKAALPRLRGLADGNSPMARAAASALQDIAGR